MAIKKLQNNFTTPEQSKRLLELGVPADSADLCYRFYTNLYEDTVMWDTPSVIAENQHIEWSHKLRSGDTAYIPCWSVGRLVEIYFTCALEYHPYDDFYTETPSLHLMAFDKDRLIEEVIKIMSEDEMDFSKLEE